VGICPAQSYTWWAKLGFRAAQGYVALDRPNSPNHANSFWHLIRVDLVSLGDGTFLGGTLFVLILVQTSLNLSTANASRISKPFW
jgi:hypothetical protein